MERCSRLSGLLAVMSVAGGTGSGLGTYLTQRLRDDYPSTFILNHLTWPYSSGEVGAAAAAAAAAPPPPGWLKLGSCSSGDGAELQLGADAGPPPAAL